MKGISIEALRRVPSSNENLSVSQHDHEVMQLFRTMYNHNTPMLPLQTRTENSISSKTIPQFFFEKTPESKIKNYLLDEARNRFLNKKDDELPADSELDTLFSLLMSVSTRSNSLNDIDWISYDNFCSLQDKVPLRTRMHFKASMFAQFARDTKVRINAVSFYDFVIRKVSLDSVRISLTSLDVDGSGYLSEKDLEQYVFDEIQELAQLQSLEEAFYPFYVFTAVRKIFFFLDPLKKGKIRITDLVTSSSLRELNDLRQPPQTECEISTSWFSANSALKVYASYLHLDKDQNGMLSKSELSLYRDGAFTEFFIDRLFQTNRTFDGEMDYKTFLDLVLALQFGCLTSLRYFWKILDINECGYLTGFNINAFFRSVMSKMSQFGLEAVNMEDVLNEIFDMVKPSDPYKITFTDLVKSGTGKTVIKILTDVNGFWEYDNREQLAQMDHDQS